jgi:uncharacterized protein YbjT (DUF2867 family)/uncharacterized membrane protein YphA (DoxX/SURF4 family)
MRILLTGANGFIGRYLLAGLLGDGHDVVPAVRRPDETDRLLPAPCSLKVDLNRDTRASDWLPRLYGIEAVINCAGILQGRPGQSIAAIHAAAPRALFEACRQSGVKRVIQISAISADTEAGTAYASTKREADEFLAASDLDWIVLRPSLVYARGAYGGTALMRALAALPFAIPVIGRGDQTFQPIHIDDLVATVVTILHRPEITRRIIDPVGPDVLTMRQILIDLRRWLGLAPAGVIEVPLTLVRALSRLGDVAGSTINSTALRQLEYGNTGSLEAFENAAGIKPRRWQTALLAEPAQAQDRQQARLYFLRPLLRLALAVLWLVSGFVGLLQPAPAVQSIGTDLGLSATPALILARGFSLLDVAIGAAVLCRWRPVWLATIQLVIVLGYTVVLSWARPILWLDPFGPLLKNLPILVGILLYAGLERER